MRSREEPDAVCMEYLGIWYKDAKDREKRSVPWSSSSLVFQTQAFLSYFQHCRRDICTHFGRGLNTVLNNREVSNSF